MTDSLAKQERTGSQIRPPVPLAARLESTLDKVGSALQIADPVVRVHEARKALKAYRALLRLIRTPEATAQRRSAAAIARRLAGDRDQQACRDALQLLVSRGHLGEEDARAVRETLRSHAGGNASDDHGAALRDWIQQARRKHAETLDDQAAAVDLPAALARGYRKARAGADVSTPDAMHELRKRVVTYRYQLAFFSDVAGGAGSGRVRKAQGLREVLGAAQDLETLKAQVKAPVAAGEALPPDLEGRLLRGVKAVQRRLARDAKAQHRRLFSRRTKMFRRRVGAALRAASET